jgi:hypothetical protein
VQDDAELGLGLKDFFVGRERDRQVRAHDHSSHQITENDRLPETLEDE